MHFGQGIYYNKDGVNLNIINKLIDKGVGLQVLRTKLITAQSIGFHTHTKTLSRLLFSREKNLFFVFFNAATLYLKSQNCKPDVLQGLFSGEI